MTAITALQNVYRVAKTRLPGSEILFPLIHFPRSLPSGEQGMMEHFNTHHESPEFCPCTSIRTFSCRAEWNSLETSDSKGYVGTLDGGFKLPSSVNPIGGPNKLIINISQSLVLSEEQNSVFAKGLSYIPTPISDKD